MRDTEPVWWHNAMKTEKEQMTMPVLVLFMVVGAANFVRRHRSMKSTRIDTVEEAVVEVIVTIVRCHSIVI